MIIKVIDLSRTDTDRQSYWLIEKHTKAAFK